MTPLDHLKSLQRKKAQCFSPRLKATDIGMAEKGVRFVIPVLPWPNTDTTGSV